MDSVEIFVGANSVHIGVNPVAGGYLILRELHTLPLGERMNHLRLNVVHRLNREFYGTFHAVEIVVHARSALNKQRSGNAAKIQVVGKTFLKIFLNVKNRLLHHLGTEPGDVSGRNL